MNKRAKRELTLNSASSETTFGEFFGPKEIVSLKVKSFLFEFFFINCSLRPHNFEHQLGQKN